MKVKFSRCNSSNLTNVPMVDGQLTFVKDTSELYLDLIDNRIRIEDKILINKVNNHNIEISNLYSNINRIDEDMLITNNNITNINNNITNINNDISNINIDIGTMDITIDNIQNDLQNIHNDITNIYNIIGNISNVIDYINGENI